MKSWEPLSRFLTISFLLAAPFLQTRAQTNDEKVVRKTYAKLSYAIKIATVHDILATNPNADLAAMDSRIDANELKFKLSSFTAGSLDEIREQEYGELVTEPDGQDVLNVAIGTYNHIDDHKKTLEIVEKTETGAMAAWSPGPNFTEPWNMKMAQVIPSTNLQNKSQYLRYVAYKVSVSFGGRGRTYNAMFLFGNGEHPVLALDNVTNNSALTALVSTSVYPAILLESSFSERPGVANWLKLHQLSDPFCRSGHREVCCDPNTLACGIAATDVSDALDRAISRIAKEQKSLHPSLQYSPHLVTVASRIDVSCDDQDFGGHGIEDLASDTTHHTTGNHGWYDNPTGSCTYTGPPQGDCVGEAQAVTNSGLTSTDIGSVLTNTCHVHGTNYVNGSATGAPVTAASNAAVEAVECSIPCTCTATITFSGQNPQFTAGNIWNHENPYSITCPAKKSTRGTPIILDTSGRGFHLTSHQNGVDFDLDGNGPKRWSWTDGNSGNAFLVLDRNGNGKIDDGSELFGDHTEQPRSDDPNGFRALAVFDETSHGGNGDGVIDQNDSVWSKLRLWIDENHDGQSQANELHTLPELGVFSIGLRYMQTRRYDQYGNLFRYKGRANPEGEPQKDKVDRILYDVYLLSQ